MLRTVDATSFGIRLGFIESDIVFTIFLIIYLLIGFVFGGRCTPTHSHRSLTGPLASVSQLLCLSLTGFPAQMSVSNPSCLSTTVLQMEVDNEIYDARNWGQQSLSLSFCCTNSVCLQYTAALRPIIVHFKRKMWRWITLWRHVRDISYSTSLNLTTRWTWMVSCMPQPFSSGRSTRYPLHRRLISYRFGPDALIYLASNHDPSIAY